MGYDAGITLSRKNLEEDAMKVQVALAALLLGAINMLAQAAPHQQVDPAKAADIRRLLELTGTKKLMEQMMNTAGDQLKSSFAKALPQNERSQKIVEAFLQKFQARFNSEMLAEQVIPIYDKYLSAEDIKGLIQFYASPLGQRMVTALPQIARESQSAGYQLGQKVARQVLQEVQEEYPELKPGQKLAPSNP
jgi:hypothetical protein